MKSEELFQIVNGAEDKYIEEASEMLALQQEAQEGVIVHAAPKSRRSVLKSVIVSVAATAAVVSGAVFLMRNVGNNGFMFEPANSFDSSVRNGDISNGNSVSGNSVPTESDSEKVTSVESDVSEPEVVNVWHPPLNYVDKGTVYKVVDPVDNRVRSVDFSDTTIHVLTHDIEYDTTIEGGSVVSLGYLREFFGTDALPFDERYKDNLERMAYNAAYNCKVSEGAKAYTPVNGKVVAVNDDNMYHNGWGNGVAIEFEDKVFVIAHLNEVNVKVGDTVTAGQTVGICGISGAVNVGDDPSCSLFSLITMVKVSD